MFGLNSLVGYAIIALIIAVSSFTAGVKVESWHRDSADLAAQESWEKTYKEQMGSARKRAETLLAAVLNGQKELRKLRLRISNVPDTITLPCTPEGSVTRPAWVVTDDDVRLWNDIVSQGRPVDGRGASGEAVRADPPTGGPGDEARPADQPGGEHGVRGGPPSSAERPN